MAAEAAISSAVELLADLLIQKVKFLRGVEGKVQSLKDELKRMQSFLEVADRKLAEDPRVRNWISDIREVAQDAQDTIELFLVNVENARSMGFLKRCTSFATCMCHLHTIGEEIETIRTRLKHIDESRGRYGIKDLGEVSDSAWRTQVESRRRLPYWKNDEHLVGVEDDVKNLLQESILDEEEKKGLSIAVVEGMLGIGKSTLARAIYNHPDVIAGRFDCRAWVVVSSEFTPQETIKQLIVEFPRSEEDKQKLRELEESTKDKLYLQQKLQEMLHKQLEGKNYFIVLDDVWEKEHWESLRNAFPDEQDKTSRLLITTRNKVIAKYSQYTLEMKVLDLDKSWELFLKKAFIHNSDGKCPEELEHTGRKIVEKCNGLPLAITVVGGLLVETQTQSGWVEVLNQLNSHLGRPDSNVSSILELSYQNLSPQLKSCFLCLAFFKEDATIPTKSLVHIWVGQGLIKQGGGRTVEEIARDCLDELINRNMVQIDDLTLDDRVKTCHLHDLLRDVCLGKAKEEIGFQIVKGEDGIEPESSFKPRHRVVYSENMETLSLYQNNHLRSLFVLNINGDDGVYLSTPSRYWKSFQLLKMLYLDGIGFRRFPDSFRALIGLKYLRIRNHSYKSLTLPRWLDHLKKLEVLDATSEYVKLSHAALKMNTLRYFSALRVYGLTSIDNWKNIETLKYISHKSWLRCNSSPMASCHVRKLGIFLYGEVGCDVLSRVRASLEKMESLVKLHLMWSPSNRIDPTITPQLHSLTKLKLSGGMSNCPAASTFPPNLSHLALEWAQLEEDPLPELGKLPKLLYLKLSQSAYEGERMQVLRYGFPCLKALSLQYMLHLRAIYIREGGMPQLKQLRIHDCPALETKNLPEHIIISHA